MELSLLINKMAIFVFLMVTGYLCARRGVTDAAFTRITSKLTINFFMSGTILKSLIELDGSFSLREMGLTLLLVTLTMALCFLLGGLVSRLTRLEAERRGIFDLLCSLGNTMFIALPVAEAVLGPRAVFIISLSNIPFNLALYSYGVWRLRGGGEGGLRLREVFSVPLIVTLLSVLIFLLRLPIPRILRELASALSGATMPLSMLVIGTALGSVSLLDTFRQRSLYLSSLVRLILAPLLVWALLRLFVADQVLLLTCVILAASPSAVIISVLSIQYERDYVYASQGVLHSTSLSMLTIPLLVYALGLA